MTRIHRGKDHRKTRRRRRAASGAGRIGDPDLRRRLRAVGLSRDSPEPAVMTPDNIRDAMARRISMAINRWSGCREPLCKRMRGCMAPRILCSNPGEEKPMSDRASARAKARLMRLFKAKAAQMKAAEAAAAAAAPFEKPGRKPARAAAPSPLVGEGIRSGANAKKG